MNNNVDKCTNSIFEKNWWLDVVAGVDWEKITVEKKNGEIAAAFPIYKTKYFGFKALRVPPFTQTLGIYLEDTGAKLTKKLEKEKKLVNEIIEKLPKDYNYDFYLDINNEYILPFIWKGFKVEPMYSYRLENLSNLDEVWSGFKENIKREIRKAVKKVEVTREKEIDVLIQMQKKTFKRQGRAFPYDEMKMKQLCDVLEQKNASLLLSARDSEGNIHAATYFVFDDHRCYYLMSGGDPDYRNSGATSLLMWEGIKYASERCDIFDFEGSMIEDIERFFRGFGAKPRIYFHVKKLNWLLSLAEYIKPKVKKLLKYK